MKVAKAEQTQMNPWMFLRKILQPEQVKVRVVVSTLHATMKSSLLTEVLKARLLEKAHQRRQSGSGEATHEESGKRPKLREQTLEVQKIVTHRC